MNGLDNSTYITMLIISNIVAIGLLWTAWKLPRLSRFLFCLLFLWAGWTNWVTALNHPEAYLEYGSMAVIGFYKDFINGWFKDHTLLAVGFVATCQLCIAIGLQARGIVFRIAAIGAIVFFIAILPLGVGAGFPCSLIMAIAMYFLLRHRTTNFLWLREKKAALQ